MKASSCATAARPIFGELLDSEIDEKYLLTPKLWDYIYQYAHKHKKKGNGCGFGLTRAEDTAL